MSYDEDYYRWDQAQVELRDEAIHEFQVDRLQSYYLEHDNLLNAPRSSLDRASRLAQIDVTASLVFGVAAIEIVIRAVLLRPMLFGLIHESNAEIISKLLVDQSGTLRHRQLLTDILREHGNFDLETYRRAGSTTPVLREVEALVSRRNTVLHRGETAAQNEAALAVAIGTDLLDHVVPSVLRTLGLKVRTDGRIGFVVTLPDGTTPDDEDDG